MPDEKVGDLDTSASGAVVLEREKGKGGGTFDRANSFLTLVAAFLTIASIVAGAVWLFQSELRKVDQQLVILREYQRNYWFVCQDIKKQLETIDDTRLQEFTEKCISMPGTWEPNQKTCTPRKGGRPERFQPLVFTEFVWEAAEPPKEVP